jgi:hypothetical protein
MGVITGSLALGTVVFAGDLNVVGNLNVASNLTANVVTLQGATVLNNPVLDFAQPGLFYRYTLTNDTTWVFTNHVAGRQVWLEVTQDSSGGWANTWPDGLLWPPGGIRTGSTDPNTFSVLKMLDDGTHWLALAEGLNYSTNRNYALSHLGAGVTAAASSDFTPQSSFTIEFWAKHSGQAEWIIHCANNSDYDGWGIEIAPTSLLFRRQAYGGISEWDFSETDTDWHHYAITYDGDTFTFYLDGTSTGTDSGSFVRDSGADLFVACPWSSTAYVLDEVRISSVARYAEGFDRCTALGFTNAANTVAYWKFDEGAGQITQDSSGNAHTGTLQGYPPVWVNGASCVGGQMASASRAFSGSRFTPSCASATVTNTLRAPTGPTITDSVGRVWQLLP